MSSPDQNQPVPPRRREWWAYLLAAAVLPLVGMRLLPSLKIPLLVVVGALCIASIVASMRHGTDGLDSLREI